MTHGSRRGWHVAVAASLIGVVTTGCGLPDGGVTEVDDEDVPYRLLAPAGQSSSPAAPRGSPPRSRALVFWVDTGDRLAPSEAPTSCGAPIGVQVEELLTLLSAGPTDEVRSKGWSSAWVSQGDLSLVELEGSRAVISVDATTPTSADRLPVAIGQVTFTVTTATDVSEVLFTDETGEPLAVPLPGGALTADPVRPTDYARLVEGGASDGWERWPGCP